MLATDYTYRWIPSSDLFLDENTLEEMARLYSDQYGIWGSHSNRPGQRVRLSAEKLRDWLKSKDSKIAMAYLRTDLIGYAIAVQSKVPDYGVVSWVTQFVIHEDHRKIGVGKALLFSIWGFSDHFTWGLVTANPYAVRALEKATRRRCDATRIAKNHTKLLAIGAEHAPYVRKEMEHSVDKNESRINTEFYVDHSHLPEMVNNVVAADKPWKLGDLPEGWEWLAFTFNDQPQMDLTASEINAMLQVSDAVVRQAYSRMLLDSSSHQWAQYAEAEAMFISKVCELDPGSSILDFGCGTGRHAIALAEMGFNVTGMDYVDTFVDRATNEARRRGVNAAFVVGDCRTADMNMQYDLAIAVYDVIGTYVDNSQNAEIVANIARHLKKGGKALISVMNYDLTARLAKRTFEFDADPNTLLDLPASQIMERTGNVFDPDYYLVDTRKQVVYRREQFSAGGLLPEELIVRDRRFRKDEIEGMCEQAGLRVIWSRFVRAGHWDTPVDHRHDHAKEILVLCEKR